MGMYDTMQQAATPLGQPVNGTSAQKSSQHMRGRGMSPATSGQNNVKAGVSSGFSTPSPMMNAGQAAGGLMSAYQQNKAQNSGVRPNPTMGQIPGQMGSRAQILQKQQLMKQKAAAEGNGIVSAIGGSMGQESPAQSYGLPTLQTPYDQQQAVPAMSPMQAAAEQMRGYEGPDLGSQDPRELARVGGMTSLYGTTGEAPQSRLQNAPFGGEQPGTNSFQSMLESMNGQRPDVMPRGLGPSMGQPMDENGMEPRRGAR